MFNQDLQTQIAYLERILGKSNTITEILKKAPDLNLPNLYLVAGAISQTFWNKLHYYPPEHPIKYSNLFYFYPNTDAMAQDGYIQRGKAAFAGLPIEIQITNEAR